MYGALLRSPALQCYLDFVIITNYIVQGLYSTMEHSKYSAGGFAILLSSSGRLPSLFKRAH